MKTSDEIKNGLAVCATLDGDCENCPYDDRKQLTCVDRSRRDALAYIIHFETRLAQVERERNAAVGDLQEAARDGAVCTACKHDEEFAEACADADFDCKQCKQPCMCKTCNANSNYEWIGLCEENTHDQPSM